MRAVKALDEEVGQKVFGRRAISLISRESASAFFEPKEPKKGEAS